MVQTAYMLQKSVRILNTPTQPNPIQKKFEETHKTEEGEWGGVGLLE